MATLPTLPTFVAGDTSITKLQQLAYFAQFLSVCDVRPTYHAYKTATQAIPGNTFTVLSGGTVAYDNDGQSTPSGSMVSTIQTQGYYACEMTAGFKQTGTSIDCYVAFLWTAGSSNPNFTAGATQRFGIRSNKSGTATAADNVLCSSDITPNVCYPGDTISPEVFCLTGLTINVNNSSQTTFQGRFNVSFTNYWLRFGT